MKTILIGLAIALLGLLPLALGWYVVHPEIWSPTPGEVDMSAGPLAVSLTLHTLVISWI